MTESPGEYRRKPRQANLSLKASCLSIMKTVEEAAYSAENATMQLGYGYMAGANGGMAKRRNGISNGGSAKLANPLAA